MSKKEAWRFVAVLCTFVCVACPFVIVRFGYNYGYDRLSSDEDYRSWCSNAVAALFWLAAFSTTGFIVLMGRWWWLAAMVALPLLCATGVLAITCGMWLEGTYW